MKCSATHLLLFNNIFYYSLGKLKGNSHVIIIFQNAVVSVFKNLIGSLFVEECRFSRIICLTLFWIYFTQRLELWHSILFVIETLNKLPVYLNAVSYTHLDVYKRQSRCCSTRYGSLAKRDISILLRYNGE